MRASVIVPVAHDEGPRDAAWRWCRKQYPRSWQIIEAPDEATGPAWSKGRAVNAYALRSTYDVLVIADCDLFIGRAALERAVLALVAGAPWVVPHGTVYRLNRAQTSMWLRRPPPDAPVAVGGRRHRGPAGGGIVVLTRAAFECVGGIDPRFCGWGGEDISFGRALDTLCGPHVRLGAAAWHLWHPPLPRYNGRASEPNEQLANAYLDAITDPEQMRALCRH